MKSMEKQQRGDARESPGGLCRPSLGAAAAGIRLPLFKPIKELRCRRKGACLSLLSPGSDGNLWGQN